MADLTKLKKTRNGHKTHVRKLVHETKELLLVYDVQNTEQRQRLKNYRSVLSRKVGVIGELDEKIIDETKEEDIEAEIVETSEFMDAVNLCLVALEENLADDPTKLAENIDTAQSSSTSNSGNSHVRLPKLEPSTFDRKSMEWSSFWDYFEAMIHFNDKLADIEKFSYLRASLKGAAASTINGLSLTGTNYSVAVKLLKERFADPQKIITSHMDALVNLPAVSSAKDLKAARQLCDGVEAHTRALEALGRKPDQYGELFLPLLLNKIPKEIRLDICSKVGSESWDLATVLHQMKREVTNRERCEYVGNLKTGASNGETEQAARPAYRAKATGAALLSGARQDNSPGCAYCHMAHQTSQCNTVTSPRKRKEILRKSGRCFICLKRNHISRNCRSKMRCSKCKSWHHHSICDQDSTHGEEHQAQAREEDQESRATASMCVGGTKSAVLLQTAKAAVYRAERPNRKLMARIILDGGSQRSYVTHQITRDLNLPVSHSESLTIKPFGLSGGTPQLCEVVSLRIVTNEGVDLTVSAISVPLISSPIQGQFPRYASRSYPHLSTLKLADDCDGEAQIDILIGADQYWNLVTGGVIRGETGPSAIHTKLGGVLSGPVNETSVEPTVSTHLNSTHVLKCEVASRPTCHSCDNELQKFWNLESLGIVRKENSVFDTFEQRINFDGKQYEVSLPWREPHPVLHDNYEISRKRLTSLLTRLKKEPGVLTEYDAVIKEQLKRGIVEQVAAEETGEVGEVHYLPHHPVIRRDKQTTKVRVVYDASAKQSGGPSLNECLYTGPPLTENIADILMRFRSHKVALVGDIEKAFLMISVAKDDRDVLRFLWVDDINKEKPEIVTLRFTRVTFGVSSSPFLLNATLKHHISKFEMEDPEFAHKFLQSLYVDDVACGDSSDAGAYQLYIKAKLRLAEGGFNLRKFASNSVTLTRKIQENEEREGQSDGRASSKECSTKAVTEEDESYAKSITGPKVIAQTTEKVLGTQWDKDDDTFVLNLEQLISQTTTEKPTKRHVVQVTSKFYDH